MTAINEKNETPKENETPPVIENTKPPLITPDELNTETPPVSEGIKAQAQTSQLVDKQGRAFDKNIHMVDKQSGLPMKTASGHLRLKCGVKSDGQKQILNVDAIQEETPQEESTRPPENFNPNGEAVASIMQAVLVSLIGDEWKYQNDEEQKMIADSFDKLMKSKGVSLPPEYEAVFCVGVYASQRIPEKNTRSKLKNAWSKILSLLGRKVIENGVSS